MRHNRPVISTIASVCAGAILILSGCSHGPNTHGSSALPRYEKIHLQLDNDFSLDYQLERKISTANGKSCYVFITGVLNNRSARTLSQRSVLDVIVLNQGKALFRDLTSPMNDIPPGGNAMFEMVTSPVHKDGCPPYENISVSLRKVFLN